MMAWTMVTASSPILTRWRMKPVFIFWLRYCFRFQTFNLSHNLSVALVGTQNRLLDGFIWFFWWYLPMSPSVFILLRESKRGLLVNILHDDWDLSTLLHIYEHEVFILCKLLIFNFTQRHSRPRWRCKGLIAHILRSLLEIMLYEDRIPS